MTANSVWKKAQTVELQVSENILPEFNIGFDKRITKEVEQELRSFVNWFESNYRIPITLWVDFEYKHYLIFARILFVLFFIFMFAMFFYELFKYCRKY